MENEPQYTPSLFEPLVPLLHEYQLCELKIAQLRRRNAVGDLNFILAFQAIQRDVQERISAIFYNRKTRQPPEN